MGFVSSDKRSQLEHTRRVLTDAINDMTDEYESDLVEEECSNDSCNSVESSSSSEMVDDISSSSSSSSSLVLSRDGPLYELSELMAQLPIKRGLSKYYQGKSESFGSLAKLKSFQDLAKRSRWPTKSPFRGQSQSQNQTLSPKGNIVKNKKISLFSSLGKMTYLLDTISVQSHF